MSPLIQDGCILAVDTSRNEQTQLNGKIVIAWQKDRGLTVSRLRRFDHTEVLEPENHGYESITISAKHRWTIIAKVLWWIAKARFSDSMCPIRRVLKSDSTEGLARTHKDAAVSSARYPQPLLSLRMVTPRAARSPSNGATPGEVSRSPGTMTAHSGSSRSSFDLICHCPKDDDFTSPIWTMDQCRTSASAAASSGKGPDRMKWLFPCTRIPTIYFQGSRRGSATEYPIAKW